MLSTGHLKHLACVVLLVSLAGCASYGQQAISPGMSENDVATRFGKPVDAGRLPSGEEYRDYTTQPFGYTNLRVIFTPEGRVRDVRNLLTEENVKNVQTGMTPDEVVGVVGRSAPYEQRSYAGGTRSWTYRYYDNGVYKLLNVIFDPNDRVAYSYSEWDPRVYSRGGDGKGSSGK
jgi:hypothetical protein